MTTSHAPAPPSLPRWRDGNAVRLVLCGFAVLFWELVLIRWLGASIRIVAYFSNLVLVSAFFGLGAGALATRLPWRLERLIVPLVSIATLLGVWLGGLGHRNPSREDELIWVGKPLGIVLPGGATGQVIAASVLLAIVYCVTALVFVAFGQYLGRLFRTHPPLRAYSLEVAGSLLGILLFALLSRGQTGPTVWFVVGFVLLVAMLPLRVPDVVIAIVLAGAVVFLTLPAARGFVWSPYYRIAVEPITRVLDRDSNELEELGRTAGYVLTVNNDFHQMMLDLKARDEEHPFFAAWRAFYDSPYHDSALLPPGPILVVGAGSGNDVAAALRNTDRRVTAVEIDPGIAELGERLHPEHPYQDPRVTLVIDDARSHFQRIRERYALVVFGFLDSHRLLSAFSSVRLDNFVYTRESMDAVRRLVVPGGAVVVSFSTRRPWIHDRIVDLLDGALDEKTAVTEVGGYVGGTLYRNGRATTGRTAGTGGRASAEGRLVPTDDWPFLYLRGRTVPEHNLVFVAIALLLGASALLILPRGERRIRLPYMFLGAAFFLLETSNVVRMSLLYGSTWWVNTVVFAGILVLVLLGNLTAAFFRVPVGACVVMITGGILLAAAVPPPTLLALPPLPRAVLAVALFLGPVYFGGLIFARLITDEPRLYEAYGSNVLGAVLGGAAEYLSLVTGFRFLLLVALVFYLLVFALLRRTRPG